MRRKKVYQCRHCPNTSTNPNDFFSEDCCMGCYEEWRAEKARAEGE